MSIDPGFNSGRPESDSFFHMEQARAQRQREIEGCAWFVHARTGMPLRDARALMTGLFGTEAVTIDTFPTWVDTEYPPAE